MNEEAKKYHASNELLVAIDWLVITAQTFIREHEKVDLSEQLKQAMRTVFVYLERFENLK